MVRGMTVPEIAAKYGRPERTIEQWIQAYPWPARIDVRPGKGASGGRHEYDAGEVDDAVRAILGLGDPDADPGELLDARQAAAEAGLSYATVRADISRGRWPGPDVKAEEDPEGKRRWKRSTVRTAMAARKPHKARRGSAG